MLSIMVVDRERDVLGLFETILKRMGHRVTTRGFLDDNVEDGEEYDLIILDMESFEKEDMLLHDATAGRTLCASSLWKESRLPPEINIEYDYFLQKPFRIESLKKILNSVKRLSP